MKKKNILFLTLILFIIALIIGIIYYINNRGSIMLGSYKGFHNTNEKIAEELVNEGTKNDIENTHEIGNTKVVPEEYKKKSNRPGSLVKVEYETLDYTNRSNIKIKKPAYVYLPYGYDENDTETKYDIIYIMHGWMMTAEGYVTSEYTNMLNIIDNLTEKEEIKPVILVSPTFDSENKTQDFERSVREIAVFNNDFRNDLVPYIESHFHTYAEGISNQDLINSREHRAFAGFSLGAVTTWYQFVYNLDYIKYFLPMSGDCWSLQTYGGLYKPVETTQYLENLVNNSNFKDDFYIYAVTGTDDPVFDQVNNQMQEMLKSDVFTKDRFSYHLKEKGAHDLVASDEYVYNALPIFFGKDK